MDTHPSKPALHPRRCQECHRYQEGAIDWERFKYLAARESGIKVAKIAMLSTLLAIPVIGQATGALLISKFLLGAREAIALDPTRSVSAPKNLNSPNPLLRLSERR